MPLPGSVGAAKKKASLLLGAPLLGHGDVGGEPGGGPSAPMASPSGVEKEYRTDRSFSETFQELLDMKF